MTTDARPLKGFQNAELAVIAMLYAGGRVAIAAMTDKDGHPLSNVEVADQHRAFGRVLGDELRERGLSDARPYISRLIGSALKIVFGADEAMVADPPKNPNLN